MCGNVTAIHYSQTCNINKIWLHFKDALPLSLCNSIPHVTLFGLVGKCGVFRSTYEKNVCVFLVGVLMATQWPHVLVNSLSWKIIICCPKKSRLNCFIGEVLIVALSSKRKPRLLKEILQHADGTITKKCCRFCQFDPFVGCPLWRKNLVLKQSQASPTQSYGSHCYVSV